MENATKALLIAAAVLIAIVLIVLGVNLLNAGGDTSGQAEKVGEALKEKTENTSTDIISKIKGGLSKDEIINIIASNSKYGEENAKTLYNTYFAERTTRIYKCNSSELNSIKAYSDTLWKESSSIYFDVGENKEYYFPGTALFEENGNKAILVVAKKES